jgi:hypothetical protein
MIDTVDVHNKSISRSTRHLYNDSFIFTQLIRYVIPVAFHAPAQPTGQTLYLRNAVSCSKKTYEDQVR